MLLLGQHLRLAPKHGPPLHQQAPTQFQQALHLFAFMRLVLVVMVQQAVQTKPMAAAVAVAVHTGISLFLLDRYIQSQFLLAWLLLLEAAQPTLRLTPVVTVQLLLAVRRALQVKMQVSQMEALIVGVLEDGVLVQDVMAEVHLAPH